ncbi:hypothetical protein [Devosia sp.]
MTRSEIDRVLEEKVAEALGLSLPSRREVPTLSGIASRRRQPVSSLEDA